MGIGSVLTWFMGLVDWAKNLITAIFSETEPYWKWIVVALVLLAFSKVKNPRISIGGK